MAPDDPSSTTRRYVGTFAALFALTVLTAAVAYVDLGAYNTPVALAIAAAKGLLVVAVFMHVRASGRMGGVFAGVGLFWVAVLIGMTLAESATR